jgi:outer membrane protein OmpA-like peptidoglycan-associated protein
VKTKAESLSRTRSIAHRLRAPLSALCLVATSAVSADLVAQASAPPKHSTYRILQNLIPQPTVTYTTSPLPASESVRFLTQARFGPGQSFCNADLRAELDGLLTSLEAYRWVESFQVVGHGDDRGGAEAQSARDRGLAERRAAAVRDVLLQRGVALTMVGLRGGAGSADDEHGRVEIIVTVRGRR